MKKLILSMTVVVMSIMAYAQPIADNAIIPISVSLNSILRLNVTSGGNIDFQVNTINQFTTGIASGPRYTTQFTVASSIDFDVMLYAEAANLIGSDLSSHTMLIGNLGYTVTPIGTGTAGAAANYLLNGTGVAPALARLNNTTTTEIVSSIPVATPGLGGAGDIAKNKFSIAWELATPAVLALTGTPTTTLLAQNIAADRYTTSVFLVLKAHD